jgi:hypothetical protein
MASAPPKTSTEAQALKAKRQADGRKAMAEYEANAEAVRAKTERLRALRLARDAAEAPAAAAAKAAKAKSSAKSSKSAKAKKDDAGKLADWIKGQQDSGRNY